MNTKKCNKCNKTLPIYHFHKARAFFDGYHEFCRKCFDIEYKTKKKTCSTCKIEKTIRDFNVDNSKKDGLKYQCKSCRKQVTKAYRDKKQ